MRFVADEELVERQQTLAVREHRFCEGDLAVLSLTLEDCTDGGACLTGAKWQEDAVDARRVWIDRDDWEVGGIFCSVGDEPVLTHRYDDVFGSEDEVRKKVAV